MRNLNIEEYPNLIDELKFNDRDINEQIEDYNLEFIDVRNEKVEWEMELPMFTTTFYSLIKKNNRVPSQEAYWKEYKTKNAKFFKEGKFSDEIMTGIQARVYRTYPSLVRDIHFSTFLNRKLDCKVIYNEKLDVSEGIDILVAKDDQLFGINCFTNTAIGHKGRELKAKRHQNFDNVKYIDIAIPIAGAKSIGNFYLYGLSQIYKIEDLIK